MSDLIDRQALCEYALNQKDKCVTPNDIMRFPSAQPVNYGSTKSDSSSQLKLNNDLISRQAAIDALGEAPEVWTDSPEEFAALSQWEMDVTAIKALPSAEPKTGRWIDAEIPLESGGAMPIQVCDQCNTFYPLAHTGGGYHFCPNCGAKMLGEDGEEE